MNKHSKEYREKHARYMREYRVRKPDVFRSIDLKKHYGITLEEAKTMLAAQGNNCALCGQPIIFPSKKSHIDHDHKMDTVRGILHGKCNVLVGMCDENPAILELAKQYLTRHSNGQS
jgi:hypothetical protein